MTQDDADFFKRLAARDKMYVGQHDGLVTLRPVDFDRVLDEAMKNVATGDTVFQFTNHELRKLKFSNDLGAAAASHIEHLRSVVCGQGEKFNAKVRDIEVSHAAQIQKWETDVAKLETTIQNQDREIKRLQKELNQANSTIKSMGVPK